MKYRSLLCVPFLTAAGIIGGVDAYIKAAPLRIVNCVSLSRIISPTRLASVEEESQADASAPHKYSPSLNLKEPSKLYTAIDREFIRVALPAFVALIADPLASIVDAIYVGRLGPVEQAAMGIAVSAQFSIAKLYNDPLLKTSTSLVAGKQGEELSKSVATAIITAVVIGIIQTLLFFLCSGQLLSLMGASGSSEMHRPAMRYLMCRSFGIPAATILLVTTSIFRGRGDTKTPLYCSSLGNLVNIILDPILIFKFKMGCAGAGAATAVSQWVTAIPLLYLLNRTVPIKIRGRKLSFFQDAAVSYFKAGGLIFIRTVAKIAAYTVTSSAAARLGTVPMAAYSLTFNLGFATSQLCESVSIAAQALLARGFPFSSQLRKLSAAHIIRRANLLGLLISMALSIATAINQNAVIGSLTGSPEVRAAAAAIMPIVLLTQLFKGLAYSTGGIILGGLDWAWSSLGMQIAAAVCIALTYLLPQSLWNIWIALAAFMATQVAVAGYRMLSNKGPWAGLYLLDESKLRAEGGQQEGEQQLMQANPF